MKILYANCLRVLIFCLLTVSIFGQGLQRSPFEDNDKIISIPVTVSDKEGRYIPGLEKDDFRVYQDGIERKISKFSTVEEPLSIAILLDTSGSTQNSLLNMKNAAVQFLDMMDSRDEFMAATFDNKINILSRLISDKARLKEALEQMQTASEDGTLLYDAVKQITQNSLAGAKGRKVVILLTDGKDLGSSIKRDELLEILEESETLVYTVYYKTGETLDKLVTDSNGVIPPLSKKEKKVAKRAMKAKLKMEKKLRKKKYLVFIPAPSDAPSETEIQLRQRKEDIEGATSIKNISEYTAGRFYVSDSANLEKVFRKAAQELKEQYWIGVRAKDLGKGGSQNLIIKTNRANAVVRTRNHFAANSLSN